MEAMAKFPDKFFELAIVDPPYGISESRRKSYHKNALTKYTAKKWDKSIPEQSFFNELFRVSKNQIIWGGNYFNLPPMPKWIVWDKGQPEGIDQSMFELAWSSMKNVQSKIFRRPISLDKNTVSNNKYLAQQHIRIHPTQKPIALYKWLLQNYAKPGDKILDTHLGSGSSRIAAWDMGFDFWGYELDADYFEAMEKRFKTHISKPTLFAPEQMYNFEQGKLF